MLEEWDCPWIVKGFGLELPKDTNYSAIRASGFREKGSIESSNAHLSAHQKVMAILSATLAPDFIHTKGNAGGVVKSSDLLVDGDFHAKLSDFGTDRAANWATVRTVPITMANACPCVQEGEAPTERASPHKTQIVETIGTAMSSEPPSRHLLTRVAVDVRSDGEARVRPYMGPEKSDQGDR
jgi:hypothetical protein